MMKRLMSGLVATAAVFTVGVSSASATPIAITVTGNTSFDVYWGLSFAKFTISDWSLTSFDLAIAPIDNLDTGTLVSFGFGLDPHVTGLSNIGNGPIFTVNPTFPPNPTIPGFSIDICAYAGNNCAGGGTGGLAPGSTDSSGVSMTLQHDSSGSVVFSPIPAKFQRGPGGGPTDATSGVCLQSNCSSSGSGELPAPVPEPATWLLVGTGVALACRRMRKKRT
jgi:hypothetical protein